MQPLAAILALLTGAAGWYYLFYSKAAQVLTGIEDEKLNRRRIRLRRAGGGVMVALGVGLYLGFYAADADVSPRLFVVVWAAVMILMAALVLLALIDVRLTLRLRDRQRQRLRLADPTPPQRGSSLDRDRPA